VLLRWLAPLRLLLQWLVALCLLLRGPVRSRRQGRGRHDIVCARRRRLRLHCLWQQLAGRQVRTRRFPHYCAAPF
jgi:hypothetical protein